MESNKDSNSQAPEIKMEKGSELTKEPAPVLATEKVEATQVQNNTVVVEKKGGLGCFGKGCIAGCVILLLCCCVTVILGVVAPSIIAQVIASSSKGQDDTLTRITADEIPALNDLPEILDAEGNMMAYTYTEEQFLASMIEGLQVQDKAGSIGIDFEENVGKFEVEMSVLVEALKADPTMSEQVNLKPEDVKGLYLTIQLSNDSEGQLVFDQLSLGNSALDPIMNSLFTPEVKDQITQSIQDALSGATSGTTDVTTGDTTEGSTEEPQTVLRKIEFKKDAVKFTFETSGIVNDQIEESDL